MRIILTTYKLTMKYKLNAWVDRTKPYIEISDSETDQIIASYDAKELRTCCNQGDLSVSDLCDSRPELHQEIASDLLSLRFGKNLTDDITEILSDLTRRDKLAKT